MMRSTILMAVLMLPVAGPALAEPLPVKFGEDTHAFRRVLGALGLKPAEPLNDLFDRPEEKVLILFGQTDTAVSPHLLKPFIDRGGAVLIATDRPTSKELYRQIGVRISGATIPGLPRAGTAYRSMVECPFVWQFDRPRESLKPPTGFLFQGMGNEPRIATNLPSEISAFENVVPLATLFSPGHSFSLDWPLPQRRTIEKQSLFAVLGLAFDLNKKGRLLVLADHSIFINEMMLQPDNDNIAFAFNIGRWLADGGGGQRRTEVLFFDDGRIQTDFRPSLQAPAPSSLPLEAVVPLADQAVVELERENAFNGMLLDATGGPRPILRAAALILTLALLLFGIYRFLQSRYQPEPRVQRLPAVTAPANLNSATVIERRHRAVIERGNLAEAARELAHQAFATIGFSPAPDAPPPVVQASAGWRRFRARRWAREVRTLWSLAVRGPSHRISPAGLRELDATLHRLLAAIAAGDVRLASGDSPI